MTRFCAGVYIWLCSWCMQAADIYVPYHTSHYTVHRTADGTTYQVILPVEQPTPTAAVMEGQSYIIPPKPTTYTVESKDFQHNTSPETDDAKDTSKATHASPVAVYHSKTT